MVNQFDSARVIIRVAFSIKIDYFVNNKLNATGFIIL